MAANFDRWEKDPFFSAAEEVQESADRMESMYRTWLHSTRNASSQWNLDDLRRDLSTAADTAKWQLEEFEHAVQNSYKNDGVDEEAKTRHRQFILAMEGKISLIKKSLASDSKQSSPRVHLNEGERDELALFLSGPDASECKTDVRIGVMDEEKSNSLVTDVISKSASNYSRGILHPSEQNVLEVKDGRFFGHRRTASASADISSWNIPIREEESASDSSSGQVEVLPRRVPSFSTFVGTMESVQKIKLPKNGFRKWKPKIFSHLRSQAQSRGSNACYERNKSCLDGCDDKQLYSWYGAFRRLLQRSLYQVQYIRSTQMTCGAVFLIFFMVLFVVRIF